jgi:hypothetical protein
MPSHSAGNHCSGQRPPAECPQQRGSNDGLRQTWRTKESKQTAAPRTEEFGTTSFGNYEFLAESPGFEPFTGILPLKFNGGYLALDILFFAPAMFFNLREVYPYYEIDMQARVVKYKNKGDEEWHIYVPREAEVARGREFFKIQ